MVFSPAIFSFLCVLCGEFLEPFKDRRQALPAADA